MISPREPRLRPPVHWWPGALTWAACGSALWWLDGRLDLANLALILVLASALAALWLPSTVAMLACALAVLGFNVAFVPPRGRIEVDLRQHTLLLMTMLAVAWIVSLLVTRQRQLRRAERMHTLRAEQLQQLGDTLRDTDDPRQCAVQLCEALSNLTGAPTTLMLPSDAPPAAHGPSTTVPDDCDFIGEADADERTGLWLCRQQTQAMGPGTGRHEEQRGWFLPLRGRHASLGAALLRLPDPPDDATALREHAQALCDQMGLAIERALAARTAAQARAEAQDQKLRNTLLAAISHDYRTPLATIIGAATALLDQADRLTPPQQRKLAATVVDEATQLNRLTTNALQLARLEAPGLTLAFEWESVEEIVGTVLRRVRQREPAHRIKAHLDPSLPLLRCDAVLLVQLLDNLVDNALKYGGDAAPIEIRARLCGDQVVLAVRDRGPGIEPAWRERIFDVFQRADPPARQAAPLDAPARRGGGVGLAVCRAIARAHGGELRLRPRSHGGASFECSLPVTPPPTPPTEPMAVSA